MSPRSSVAPVVASGTASVVKLLVATLAFTGAYLGVEVSHSASVPARAGVSAQSAPVRTVSLSSKSAPLVTAEAPAAGAITVDTLAGLRPCEKSYLIQGMVDNPHPESVVSYGWRLQRWSAATRNWRTYLTRNAGFAGPSQTARWRPSVIDNPGWYRAELSVSGGARLRSEKFLVSC